MFELFGATVSIASIVLFAAGILFLFIELFTPGLGIFGGLGLISLILCIVFTANSVESALLMIVIIGAILALFALLFVRSLKKGVIYKSFVLKDAENKENGFISNADYTRLIGKTGKSVTALRPAGIAVFNNEKVDVVTDGDFIPPDTAVKVYEAAGRRVTVRLAHSAKKDKSIGRDTAGNSLDI
jgi:membrane-bound serine protease (ClpP class)